MEPSQVRTRLSAGGKWIRTYGPSQGFRHPSRWRANRRRASERPFLYGGTGGSNPSQQILTVIRIEGTVGDDLRAISKCKWSGPASEQIAKAGVLLEIIDRPRRAPALDILRRCG